mgnify:CR=1 FL=1
MVYFLTRPAFLAAVAVFISTKSSFSLQEVMIELPDVLQYMAVYIMCNN